MFQTIVGKVGGLEDPPKLRVSDISNFQRFSNNRPFVESCTGFHGFQTGFKQVSTGFKRNHPIKEKLKKQKSQLMKQNILYKTLIAQMSVLFFFIVNRIGVGLLRWT